LTWYYQDEPFNDPLDYFGFVYIIENIINNKKYIGKKQFYFKKYKKVKGKRKSYLQESDWREYWSSSDILKEEVQNIGKYSFKRTILVLCKTKSECSYWESKLQFEYDVLIKPEEFYNEWIMCKIRRSHLIKRK
jgi:hypothetical protein